MKPIHQVKPAMRAMIARFVERVGEHGVQERTPLLEGKAMHITMASTHKPKPHEAQAQRGHRPEAAATNGAEAPAEPAEQPAAQATETEPKSEQPAAQPASTAATQAAATGE